MTRLYKKNDPANNAYLISNGEISVGLGSGIKVNFPGDDIIVGTLEFFLESVIGEKVPRLFDLNISPDNCAKEISFQTVTEMMTQFKFGCNTNIFIARLIEHFTASLIQKSQNPIRVFKKIPTSSRSLCKNRRSSF